MSVFVGTYPDFSKNVNLEELVISENQCTGNVNLDFQPSELKLLFVFLRASARFFKEYSSPDTKPEVQ